MDLISLVIALVVIGVLLCLVETVIPLDPDIRKIIRVVVIIAVVLWLLSLFVGMPHIFVGRR